MRRYDYSQPVQLNEYEDAYPLEIPRRYDVPLDMAEFLDDLEWQVTYKFSAAVRRNQFPNGKYGSDEMTYRRLYVILCEKFNDGNYFIEDYFRVDYPRREIKKQADEFLRKVNEEIMNEFAEIMSSARLNKSGKLDKRFKRTIKKLSEYRIMSDERVRIAGEILSERVKTDIVQCLNTGILYLSKKMLAESTVEQRKKLGFPADTVFFASGQLIQHVQVFFRLEKKEWINQYL